MADFLACLCRGSVTKGVQALNYRSRGGAAAVEPSPLREHGALEQNRLPPRLQRRGKAQAGEALGGQLGVPHPPNHDPEHRGSVCPPVGTGMGRSGFRARSCSASAIQGTRAELQLLLGEAPGKMGGLKRDSVLGDVEEEALKLPKPLLELGPSSGRGYK